MEDRQRLNAAISQILRVIGQVSYCTIDAMVFYIYTTRWVQVVCVYVSYIVFHYLNQQ